MTPWGDNREFPTTGTSATYASPSAKKPLSKIWLRPRLRLGRNSMNSDDCTGASPPAASPTAKRHAASTAKLGENADTAPAAASNA